MCQYFCLGIFKAIKNNTVSKCWYLLHMKILGFFLWFFVPLKNFSLIWIRHYCRWRAANIDLCSTLMAIERRGLFSVPHLLWHKASVYNGHLRGAVTLTTIAERLSVGLSLTVFTIWVCRGLDLNTQPSACEANILIDCATAAVLHVKNNLLNL